MVPCDHSAMSVDDLLQYAMPTQASHALATLCHKEHRSIRDRVGVNTKRLQDIQRTLERLEMTMDDIAEKLTVNACVPIV